MSVGLIDDTGRVVLFGTVDELDNLGDCSDFERTDDGVERIYQVIAYDGCVDSEHDTLNDALRAHRASDTTLFISAIG